MDANLIRSKLARQAVVMDLGGGKATKDPAASWFGRVNLALPGETWPECEGEPMHPLCQINLTTLPFRPPRLDDISFITVFIGPDELPMDTANGNGWCLRAYKDLSALVPLGKVESHSPIKASQLTPRVVAADFPGLEDIPPDVAGEIDDEYSERYITVDGIKLGGWPQLIQSEIFWAGNDDHAGSPEYVFQINSPKRTRWAWGDGGVGYFGRCRAAGHQDEWALSWQSF
jgi:hypothetical protein